MNMPLKTIKIVLCYVAATLIVVALFLIKGNAYASENTFCIIAKNRKYYFYESEIGVYKGEYYLKNVDDVIDGIYYDTSILKKEPEVVFSPNVLVKDENPICVIPSITGEVLDKQRLKSDIVNALNNEGSKTVIAHYSTVFPTKTISEVSKQTKLISRFTTYYYSSSDERKRNIYLSASKINGTIIENGEEFSFNKTVGERTEENGYMQAKVIQNGELVEGVGGGVCQVSTTLYNCAILCGMQITEHHPHSLAVSYVEPSFDAMVNFLYSDLKFKNNSGAPIYVKVSADGYSLTCAFYGVNNGEVYERVSVVKQLIPPQDALTIYDSTLAKGESVNVQQAKDGIVSEGFLIVYKNGVRVKNLKIREDVYGAVRGKVLVGKGSS